jgi:hypothetical protein
MVVMMQRPEPSEDDILLTGKSIIAARVSLVDASLSILNFFSLSSSTCFTAKRAGG